MRRLARAWNMELTLLFLTLLPLAFLPEFGADEEGDQADEVTEPADVSLQPLAPTIADDATDPDAQDPEGEILAPGEDTPDNPEFAPVDDEALKPVDTIEGVDGTLRLDFEDVTATGYVEVLDFDPGQDTLEILIEPGSLQAGPGVDFQVSADGQDASVYVEGRLVAILKGAAQATSDDVRVSVVA